MIKKLESGQKGSTNLAENLLIANKYKRELLFKTLDVRPFIFK